MSNIVLRTLSLFLGFLFILMGIIKVTQLLSDEMYREVRRSYIHLAKVFPLLTQLGYKVSPKVYRLVVGYLEIVGGIIFLVVPYGKVKLTTNAVLLVVMLNAIYCHYAIKDRFDRIAPCIIFALMLTCRLIVQYQVNQRDRQQAQLKSTIARAKEALRLQAEMHGREEPTEANNNNSDDNDNNNKDKTE